MTLDRPVALVTGSSSGIGLLTAIELSRTGHRVFASMRDLTRRDRLDQAAAAAGVEVEVIELEVTSQASIESAVGRLTATSGRIDVLVNNAGFGMAGFFEDLTLDEIRAQLETNFFGVCAVTRAVLPGMRERRRGHIINVSSIAGRLGNPAFSAYCASKWAVEGMSESLRLELLPFGVHVALVEPGMFKTDIFDRNARIAKRARDPGSAYHAATRRLETFVKRRVAKSAGDPIEVARVIAKVAACPRPRLRYLVGRDARGEALAKALVPHRFLERAILRYVGADRWANS